MIFLKISFLRKQGNASSRPWYHASRSWVVLHEQSSVRLDSARQSGLLTILYHDRDIMSSRSWHDHEQPSWSWHVLKQTLGCSRPYITIVTSSLSARDLRKILVFNWFIIGLFLSFIVAFWGATFLVSEWVLGLKLGFEG